MQQQLGQPQQPLLLCVNTKENGKSPSSESGPALWPPRNNNLLSRGCSSSSSRPQQKSFHHVAQPQPQTWNKNVVVQASSKDDDGSFGIFSSLWRKRSRTAKPAPNGMDCTNQVQHQQPSWMTLRIAPPQQFDQVNHNYAAAAAAAPQSRPLMHQSKTLGRPPTSNNHVVMPNPDDILPKEAWTDFSGTDEWPRFSRNEESSSRLYVNCSTAAKQEDEDNGNNVCFRRSESESNNNRPRNEADLPLQQIESSLMMATAANDQKLLPEDCDKRRPRPKPLPPQRSCIKNNLEQDLLQRKKKKKRRTKRQQQHHVLVSQSKGNGNGLGGHHANDDESFSSSNGSDSDSDKERSPLFEDQPQWQTSPL